MAISAPSDFLTPNFIILVYPPAFFSYLGAITSKSFLVSGARFESRAITTRRFASPPTFARVTSFSINGLSSLAFGSVVLILPRTIKLSASEFTSAFLTFLTLPNFLFELWCRILIFFQTLIILLNSIRIYLKLS